MTTLLSTNECRNEMVDRVARYRFDYNRWNLSCYSPRVQAVLYGFSLIGSLGGGLDSGSSDT